MCLFDCRGTASVAFAAALVLSACLTGQAETTEMSVQVKQIELRAAPSYLAAIVATLNYGDRLSVYEKEGNWCHVGKTGQPASGWIHASALTRQRIILQAGNDTRTGASSTEVALAGKGFNSDVEDAFKAGHKDIDFRWIDRMEAIRIPAGDIQAFLQAGAVTPAKEGAP